MTDFQLPGSVLSRRMLLSGIVVGTLGAADADARKKKKRRKKRRKRHGGGVSVAAPARPFPQHVAYGAIRPNQWSQTDLDSHVRAAYDRWKGNYLARVDGDGNGAQYRVRLSRNGDQRDVTVSEGQGYGLLIAATMAGHDPDAQGICNGLWRFARAHRSEVDNRLMDWRVPGGQGNDSAFDGDADLAYGLLIADAQWGSGGAMNYRAAFNETLSGIMASTIGPQSRLPLLGDWVQPGDTQYNQYTPRSSDFMPGHFRTWGRATADPVWDGVVAACQSAVTGLQTTYSPGAGLLPDFSVPRSAQDQSLQPAPAGFLEGATDGQYSFNACRVPWRLGADGLLHGDATSIAQALSITRWAQGVTAGSPAAFHPGYQLNGAPNAEGSYFSSAFVAPLGVAAMLDDAAQDWLNAIYDSVRGVEQNYYEDTITLLCLLLMSGNFRDPTR